MSSTAQQQGLAIDVASERIAFSIGWDHAYYGQPCPQEDLHVQCGFAAGRSRVGLHPVKADRYVRKWLQLRSSAWRRQRVFSESITPDYLRCIDVARCPILDIELTYGTQTDTDWSVDRLNNEGAYAAGNLVVMSTRANLAKGSLGIGQVAASAGASESSAGVTPRQWLTLSSLMAGACISSDALCWPLAHPYVPKVPLLFSQSLQVAFLVEQRNGELQVMRQIRKHCLATARHRQDFEVLIKRMRKREKKSPLVHDFWTDIALFTAFRNWFTGLDHASMGEIRQLLTIRARGKGTVYTFDDWCLDNSGYYR